MARQQTSDASLLAFGFASLEKKPATIFLKTPPSRMVTRCITETIKVHSFKYFKFFNNFLGEGQKGGAVSAAL